jgi:protein TonB
LLFGLSLLVHGSLAAALGGVRQEPRRAPTAVTMTEVKKRPEPPKPAELPRPAEPIEPSRANPPPRPAARRAAQAPATPAAPTPAARAAAPSAFDALPDLGLSLSGSVGGLAVPASPAPAGEAAPAAARPAAAPRPAPRPAEECDEPVKKAKPLAMVQPAYTPQAIEARIEGKVRVELSLDEQGAVRSARILSSLGHGLDERALDAARRGSFAPATRCGKPVATTLVVGVRFSL